MRCILDDNSVVEITLKHEGDATLVEINGFTGEFWSELFPKMLTSTDPSAAEIIAEILMWLDANEQTIPGSSGHTDKHIVCVGDRDLLGGDMPADENVINTYLESFISLLKTLKNAEGRKMVQAMAGYQPVLIYRTLTDRFCFSFPPSPIVYTPDDVKDMLKTGKYSIGKRYMDALVEILCE